MYKHFTFVFTLLFLSACAFGQHKLPPPPRAPTKAEQSCQDKHDACSNNHTYSVKQRRAFYPFNRAVTVRLISYENSKPNTDIIIDTGSVQHAPKEEPKELITAIKPGEFVVNYDKVKEFKDLSKTDIDILTDMLYNIGLTPIKCGGLEIADAGYSCYNPRNSILFIDKHGKVIQYIEICFECQRFYLSSSKIKRIAYCTQKYEILRKFFKNKGILYGTKQERFNYRYKKITFP